MSACSGTQRPTRQITGAFNFRCSPQDSTLIVDEVIQGACSLFERQALGVGPGAHRVRVEHEGFLPHEQEVTGNGRRVLIEVQLRAIPE